MNTQTTETTPTFGDLQSCITRGQKLVRFISDSQFTLGDLILYVYDTELCSLSHFAASINISKGAASEYKKVAENFTPFARRTFQAHGVLVWTHFRLVVRCFPDDYSLMCHWLEQAAANLWTVDELKARLISTDTGERLHTLGEPVYTVTDRYGIAQITTGKPNTKVKIVVYEVGELEREAAGACVLATRLPPQPKRYLLA